jgi:Zn-dependent protease with chaperone function
VPFAQTDASQGLCPQCGLAVSAVHGFVSWCPACDWNVDPGAPPPPRSRRARRAQDRAARRGEQLYQQFLCEPDLRPRWDVNRVATVAAAVAVHLLGLTIVGGAVALAAWGWPGPAVLLLAAGLLAVAWVVRPRVGHLRRGVTARPLSEYPALGRVVDRVAAVTGSRRPDLVVIDGAFNASWGTVGLRRTRVLTLGRPLWAAASSQQRLALLAHELAHEVNGDVTHSLIVGSAVASLTEWHRLLLAGHSGYKRSRGSALRGDVLRVMLWIPALVPLGIQRLVAPAHDRSQQRAEYRADELAAKVAGAQGAASLMDLLLLADSILLTLKRASSQQVPDPVAYLRQHIAAVPEFEIERLRRVGERRGYRVDDTHPPTHLRGRFLRSLPAAQPAVCATEEEMAQTDKEVLVAS